MADRENFIVIYGHLNGETLETSMFFLVCLFTSLSRDWIDNPDIAYMEVAIEEVKGLYNIDLSRIYVSGHSRGGALSIIAPLNVLIFLLDTVYADSHPVMNTMYDYRTRTDSQSPRDSCSWRKRPRRRSS